MDNINKVPNFYKLFTDYRLNFIIVDFDTLMLMSKISGEFFNEK